MLPKLFDGSCDGDKTHVVGSDDVGFAGAGGVGVGGGGGSDSGDSGDGVGAKPPVFSLIRLDTAAPAHRSSVTISPAVTIATHHLARYLNI